VTFVTWFALMALAIGAVAIGRVDVALLLAGCKALLVGLQFMELRDAARLHAAAFVLWAGLVTAVLVLLSR